MQHVASPRSLSIDSFRYELPDDRIAIHPLEKRDASKLLVYKNGQIKEWHYHNLPEQIPSGYTLVFNKTRVVQARLNFRKPTGGQIELFCLEPDTRYPDITTAMLQSGKVYWICLVGGAAKWKAAQVLELDASNGLKLEARLAEKLSGAYLIELSWNRTDVSFAEVLQMAGKIPIPPYIKRAADETDKVRYQTIYAEAEGSVAAPTAGLHFSEKILMELAEKNIRTEMLTLHVGAGTFQPVKAETMEGHDMHAEFIEVDRSAIEHLRENAGKIIAVGTTSLRTLETIYWMGVKAHYLPQAAITELSIEQWEIYDHWMQKTISAKDALTALLNWMHKNNNRKLICKTRILLAPGYKMRMIEALITNFHQPQSTLLLLVAAAIGEDWKKVYQYALDNQFRFLSYGDGSLLWCKK
jgi:S-adenosylmethionine:tRNA ribosyltransferase-isomerase